ncbi:ORC-CDC6 family AAA ATPase [Salinibius halmophilus]|uniref:ORC-CDC6 family AAA ATPase n=1 Tax=Salinibius halmophilus TaxID=1853216 RepID=UPI000E675DE9|nr:hypothetical protein [Salinibius halmophilus]
MEKNDNPFHDLWLTEKLNPSEYVSLFSPKIAESTDELWSNSNIVIKGRQGSGKSMLMSLFELKNRIEFSRSGIATPIPEKDRCFLYAKTHLIQDNIKEIAYRANEVPKENIDTWLYKTFSDIFNTKIIIDITKNILHLKKEQDLDSVLTKELKIQISKEQIEEFSQKISNDNFYSNYYSTSKSLEDFLLSAQERITKYRQYFNFNENKICNRVNQTTQPIGEPIEKFIDILKECGIIPKECQLYIGIDQHEELYEIEKNEYNTTIFRKAINQALSQRTQKISYRVGTRHYAWDASLEAFGSNASIEEYRDYVIVNIDEILKPKEDPSTKVVFKNFAEDVFQRRLSHLGTGNRSIPIKNIPANELLTRVLGKSLSPKERARAYVKNKPFIIPLPDHLSDEWINYIKSDWKSEPLYAYLTSCWLRQKKQNNWDLLSSTTPNKVVSWKEKKYWIKERNEAATIQLAGLCKEVPIWSGAEHVIGLSGSNILVFMSICRAIWSNWLRITSTEELKLIDLPSIPSKQQNIGIHEASKIWVDKLREGSNGFERKEFITKISDWISKKLREDKALSNPGNTGFSIKKDEFKKGDEISRIIGLCVDNGDLIESQHTPKNIGTGDRIKWHLNPILCPTFRIPHIRTKEPIYTSLDEINSIYNGKKIAPEVQSGPTQLSLF